MITPWSFRLLVCSCLLWTLAVGESRKSNYIILYTKSVERGKDIELSVHFPGASKPVDLRLDLMDKHGRLLQKGQSYTFETHNRQDTIKFLISKDQPWSQYAYLYMEASGGLEFLHFQHIKVIDRRKSVLIQTDKDEYRPGQKVRFRALVLNPDATVSNSAMRITITDPYFNKIGEWSRKADGKSRSPAFEGEMAISKGARLGTWKMMVTADGQTTEKTFSFVDYANPRYTMQVEFPRYAKESDNKVVGKIIAKYTNGVPIKGTGKVVARMMLYRNTNHTIEKPVELVQGVATVEFTTKELKDVGFLSYANGRPYKKEYFSLNDRSFSFTVHITKTLTGKIITNRAVTKFYSYHNKLRMIPPIPYRFKPGLGFTLYVQAVGKNGITLKNFKNTEVTFTVSYYRPRKPKEIFFNETVKMNSDAIAMVTVSPVPENTTRVYYTITDGKNTLSEDMNPFSSRSKTYLDLTVKEKQTEVGETLKIQVTSNKPLNSFKYQVQSNGKILVDEMVFNANGTSRSYTIDILLTKEMVSEAYLLVYLEKDGEIVADRMRLNVESSLDQLKLEFKDKTVKPGEKAKLIVKATRKSSVFLLGWNEMGGMPVKDIHSEIYMNALKQLSGFSSNDDRISDTDDIFRQSLVDIITDARISGRYSYRYNPRTYYYGRTKQYMQYHSDQQLPTPPGPPAKSVKMPLTPAERLKKFLPDTLVWQAVDMGSNETVVLEMDTPDSITKVAVFGFSVHPSLGISVAKELAQVEISKRLFITADLPRTAILDEIVCFHANIYNHGDKNETVRVGIKKDKSSYTAVTVKRKRSSKVTEVEDFTYEFVGLVKAGSSMITPMCIKPIRVGKMKIKLYVKGNEPSDDTEVTIKVKAKGVPQYKTYTVLGEIDSSGDFSETLDIAIPADAVNESVTIDVVITGNVLGVMANNLDNLLQVPYECGEQNMIRFTPQAYLLNYLKKTGRQPEDIVSRAKNVMMAAYQRELTYQRYDGSYSSFGNRDTSGNMWLTAFIAKSFVQARRMGIMTIEHDVIKRALNWITQFQNTDGSFREMGQAIHPALQGGDAEDIRLTAYIVICLADTQTSLSEDEYDITLSRIRYALPMAVSYLEGQMPRVKSDDSYTACILAFALTLVNSSKAVEAIQNMNKMAVTEGKVKYWGGLSKSLNSEMTSYALMTLKKTESKDLKQVYIWLVTQMGATGGFTSVQATSLAVEALTAMTDMASGASVPSVEATVQTGKTKVKADFASSNVFVLKKKSISLKDGEYPTKFMLTAKSQVSGKQTAYALFQVVVRYTVESKKDPRFGIDALTRNGKPKKLSLKTCVNTNQSNAMIVTQIEVPTGYKVMKTSSKFGKAVGLGFEREKVVLYHYGSKLAEEEDCSTLRMKTSTVAYTKPTSLHMFDLANPDQQVIGKYQTKRNTVCDVSDMPGCPAS